MGEGLLRESDWSRNGAVTDAVEIGGNYLVQEKHFRLLGSQVHDDQPSVWINVWS